MSPVADGAGAVPGRTEPATKGPVPATRGMAVVARNLVLRLGSSDILRGVDVDLEAGQTLAVLGPNGAGKTTFLRVLATLLPATSGEVIILGHDPRRQAPSLRRQVGYVAHQTFLYPQLTGWENLWFWSRAYGVSNPAARIDTMLDLVGLDFFAHDPVRHYSRGMQQRLALARALLHEPSLLLLDEPYTGLDRQASELLDRVILDSRQRGRTVIITSHDLSRALAVSDRVVVLQRGKVMLQAAAQDVELGWLEAACGAPARRGGGDGS